MSGYLDGGKQDEDLVKILNKVLKKGVKILWVIDDFTFFSIIKCLDLTKTTTKFNFYEFKCQGFHYKGIHFKNTRLKTLLSFGLKTSILDLDIKTNFCYTYGAYALKILKHLIREDIVQPTKIVLELKKDLRKAYVGGRNEYIQEPDRGLHLFSADFNMMYYNCLKSEYLVGNIYKKQTNKLEGPGFYYIKYESKDNFIPILYQRNVKTEQNYFCNGVGEGLFGYEEIELFLCEGGVLHKVYYMFGGEAYMKNYTPYIEWIDKYKQKNVVKGLANNLYGKLAMKDFFYQYKLVDEEVFLLRNTANIVGRWAQGYEYYVYEDLLYTTYNDYTDINTASAITSKARIKLYGLIKNVEKRGQICLLNTDEVIFTSKEFLKLDLLENVKLRLITYGEFEAKKKMYNNKRLSIDDKKTRPYTLINNMLL